MLHFDETSEKSRANAGIPTSLRRDPPLGSILHLHKVPPDGGGATLFASMYAAYDELSPRMRPSSTA